MNNLQLFNAWFDTNQRLKNCECLMSKYPNDMSLKVEHQQLKESEAKLKDKLDKSREIKEDLEQMRQDCEGVEL
jgi:predicted DNA-binding protein YlxM (UPF0122 family)